MRVGDMVRFKMTDGQEEYLVGLLLRYDRYTKVAEIMMDNSIYYAPGRLVEVYQRGYK